MVDRNPVTFRSLCFLPLIFDKPSRQQNPEVRSSYLVSTMSASVHFSQIPSSSVSWSGLRKQSPLFLPLPSFPLTPFTQKRNKKLIFINANYRLTSTSVFPKPHPTRRNPSVAAGRSKKKPGGSSSGRIEGNADVRREAKRNARRRSRRLAENLFYRLKNPHKNHADNFTEDELQMIGLGYDRMVRFMEKDDPNLRHPYDWYKYGEYGPYRWRGIVVGEPIRGRFSDETVTLIGQVRDHEEWEKIEQHDMAVDFGKRLEQLDKNLGLKYFWVFVRHPKWKMTELPWEQWTLVSEVVVESGEQRLDKWSLMGRLGNKTRALITQCAAWMRPDIVYVKRPIFQCRFEPQDNFFKPLGPLLDPETENEFKFELELEDGRVEICTYFGGLCKIVKVNPKAFVDDVVKGYDKLSDERKFKCLEFLLSNHPMELLHPYTKEWKAKLEEMELGCDAPDDDENDEWDGVEVVDWLEDDGRNTEDNDGPESDDDEIDALHRTEVVNSVKDDEDYSSDYSEEDENAVVDMGNSEDEEMLGMEEERRKEEETKGYWDEQFQKALSSPAAMEELVKKSVERSTPFYKKQLKAMYEESKQREKESELRALYEQSENKESDGDASDMDAEDEKHINKEWEEVKSGPIRRIKKSRIPPELFLRAAVRPFTYRNLVKEIVLMRHAIIDGEFTLAEVISECTKEVPFIACNMMVDRFLRLIHVRQGTCIICRNFLEVYSNMLLTHLVDAKLLEIKLLQLTARKSFGRHSSVTLKYMLILLLQQHPLGRGRPILQQKLKKCHVSRCTVPIFHYYDSVLHYPVSADSSNAPLPLPLQWFSYPSSLATKGYLPEKDVRLQIRGPASLLAQLPLVWGYGTQQLITKLDYYKYSFEKLKSYLEAMLNRGPACPLCARSRDSPLNPKLRGLNCLPDL
ncbi:hypothetical protein H6P81_019083 [Aristolochia fimbriata]|uniref:Uncharacterized protein n=1 Tax=Aristolochia fimbriata TaxID=158543 RepID=A0AAV7DVB9_ARIFI|nr:hypothetical protein H6P81_019083 [Aristolochia fimbriata]